MLGVTKTDVDWADVGLFVAISFGLSWGAWLGLRSVFQPLAIRTFLAMFGPTFGVVAVIRLRRGEHLRHHWRLTWRRLLENIFGSGLAIIVIGVPMLAGLGLSLFSGDLRLPGSSGENLFEVLPFPAALFLYWFTAFGEEYGWRGFLVPALTPLGGARASILTAFIFASCHAPAILFDGFNYPLYSNSARTTSIIAAPVGLLGTVPFAVVAALSPTTGRLWRRVEPVS